MMRNASCFVTLFLVSKISYIFQKLQVSQILILYTTFSIKTSYATYECTPKPLTRWHLKVIASGVKQHLANHCIPPITAYFSDHHFFK